MKRERGRRDQVAARIFDLGAGRKALAAPLKKTKTLILTTQTGRPKKEVRPKQMIPLDEVDFKEF